MCCGSMDLAMLENVPCISSSRTAKNCSTNEGEISYKGVSCVHRGAIEQKGEANIIQSRLQSRYFKPVRRLLVIQFNIHIQAITHASPSTRLLK